MAQNNMDEDIKSISGGSHICKCFTCGKSMMNHKSMKNHKKSNKYFLIESDQSCHDSLLKIGTNILDIDSYININLQFDVVIISHVLEHVSDPIEFLKLMTLKLREGGILYVDVPCLDYLHKELDEPHLLFF